MRSSIMIIVAITACATSGLLAQVTRYGVVKTDRARVMGGLEESAAQITRLGKGEVVEVIGEREGWTEVRLARQYSLYAREKTQSGRVFLRVDGDEAEVLIDDLLIRPRPNRDWPALGEYRKGDRLRILKRHPESWLEVAAPREQGLFIASTDVAVEGDPADLARRFAALRSERVPAPPSVNTPRRQPDVKKPLKNAAAKGSQELDPKHLEELRGLDRDYDRLLGQKASKSDLATLRRRYEIFAQKVPAKSVTGELAQRRANRLRQRENVVSGIDSASSRLETLEKEMASSSTRYRKELEELRITKRKEAIATLKSDGRTASRHGRFLENGIGKVYQHFGASFGDERAVYILTKAGERRYRLVSDRYDFEEFRDKTIGITKWDLLDDASGSPFPKVRVRRLEILR